MNRQTLIDQTAAAVLGSREQSHGKPEDSFSVIAQYWTTYLQGCKLMDKSHSLSSDQVAALMILFKMGRVTLKPTNDDSWVDIAGYAACGVESATEGKHVIGMKAAPDCIGASEGLDLNEPFKKAVRDLFTKIHTHSGYSYDAADYKALSVVNRWACGEKVALLKTDMARVEDWLAREAKAAEPRSDKAHEQPMSLAAHHSKVEVVVRRIKDIYRGTSRSLTMRDAVLLKSFVDTHDNGGSFSSMEVGQAELILARANLL